ATSNVPGSRRTRASLQDDLPVPVSAASCVAKRDSRRLAGGGELEQRERVYLLRARWRDSQQPGRRPGDRDAQPASAADLSGIHQHADDPAHSGRTKLARPTDAHRPARSDAARVHSHQPLWNVPAGYEHPFADRTTPARPGHGVRTNVAVRRARWIAYVL